MATSRMRTLVILCLAAATILKLALAARTTGTNDVLFYHAYWKKSQEPGGGIGLYQHGIELLDFRGRPYRREPYMNTPFVIHLLRTCGRLSEQTSLPFPFWLRVPSILADAGLVFLLWRMAAPAPAVAIAALSPVTILVSGFHGSTDSLVVFFLALAVFLLDRKASIWLAGVAFGMSLNIKVWPAMFVPAILAFLPDWNQRLRFTAALGGTFLLGSMPFVAQDPVLVMSRLLGYPSVFGQWGLSRVITWFAAVSGWNWVAGLFEAVGRFVALGVVAVMGVWLHRKSRASPLAARVAMLTGVFLAITPGFGVQYLAWVAPWIAFAGFEAVLLFAFAGGVFLYAVYNYWSQGQWQVANSLVAAPWSGTMIFYELLCWMSVLAITYALWKSLPVSPEPAAARPATRRGRKPPKA